MTTLGERTAPDNIRIRALAPDDCDEVARFECEISRVSFGDEAVTDLDHHRRRVRKILEKPDEFAVVLDDGNRLLGWAWLGPRQNFITHETYADFRSLYIAPQARGSNCAFRLMQACLEHCRSKGYPRIVGRTHSDNEAMRALYALYRFEPTTVTYELRLD